MNNLEKIYYNLDKLYDGWKDSGETQEAYSALLRALGKDSFMELEDYIGTYASAVEKQGFVAGFRYAVSLLMDGREGKK